MTVLTIVRTEKELPKSLEAVREFLFGVIDGFNKKDRAGWRRLWKKIYSLDPGEMLTLEIVFPRSGLFHRRHMKIEQTIFDQQERFDNFEMFRYWLKVGSGFVTWAAGPKGGVVPIPKSISYAKADEEEFRQFHADAMQFLRGPHAAKYLWPKAPDPYASMDAILNEFGE